MSNLDVTETTLQFVIKVFAILLAGLISLIGITYAVIVIHDGNNPLVQSAFSDLASLGQWAIMALAGIVIGKPIASGVGNFFNNKNGTPPNTDSLPPTPDSTGQTAT